MFTANGNVARFLRKCCLTTHSIVYHYIIRTTPFTKAEIRSRPSTYVCCTLK